VPIGIHFHFGNNQRMFRINFDFSSRPFGNGVILKSIGIREFNIVLVAAITAGRRTFGNVSGVENSPDAQSCGVFMGSLHHLRQIMVTAKVGTSLTAFFG
jgi:hypothetical protein